MYNTLEMLSEIWYTYDDGRREKAYTYTYNYDGTLNKIDDLREDSSIEFTYDSRGRLVSSLEAYADDLYSANWNRVNYDTENRVSSHIYSITYSSTDSALTRYFTTSYEYETNGYVSRENLSYLSNSHNINYNYDSFNRPDEVVRNLGGFNYTTKYTYLSNGTNTSNRISKYVNTVNGTEKDYTYTYNSKGNITKANYPNGESITYVYDNLGQLLREEHELANTNYEYTYDDAGNITTIKKIIINESLDDDFIQLRAIYPIGSKITTVNLRYTNSEWGDLLTSYDGTAITYDEIGNPLSYYNGTSYEFEWEGRRLVSAVKGSDTLSFTYNDEGIRTGKTVNGVKHTYYLNGSLIMAEEWEDKLIVYIYDASGSPIGMMFRKTSYDIEDWDVYWFEKNLQGDVVSVYNNAGDEVAYYMYNEAWGSHSVGLLNSADNEGARYNPFRYRGYYYDTDLGMYYLQSRYYDAKICRFINADGVLYHSILGYNLFAYCENNPIVRVDYRGNMWQFVPALDPANMVYGGGGDNGLFGCHPGYSYSASYDSSAYGTYLIKTSTASYDAYSGGYYFGGGSFIGGYTAQFATGGNVSVTDSMAAKGGSNITTSRLNFKTKYDLEEHFNRHGKEFEDLYSNSQEYLNGANYVINNGTYVPEMNGYIRFFGAKGGANYAFVGLTRDGLNITTFSIRSVASLSKIPWIVP